MPRNFLIAAALVAGALVVMASTAQSQESADSSGRPSLSERLDQFRRNLMNGWEDRDSEAKATQPSRPQPSVAAPTDPAFTPRPTMPQPPAGAAVRRTTPTDTSPARPQTPAVATTPNIARPTERTPVVPPVATRPAPSAPATVLPPPVATSDKGAVISDMPAEIPLTARTPPPRSPAPQSATPAAPASGVPPSSRRTAAAIGDTVTPPLSADQATAPGPAASHPLPLPPRAARSTPGTETIVAPDAITARRDPPRTDPTPAEPASAAPYPAATNSAPSTSATLPITSNTPPQPLPATTPPTAPAAGTPDAHEARIAPLARPERPVPSTTTPPASPVPTTARSATAAPLPSSATPSRATPPPAAAGDDVLFVRRSPELTVQTSGPKQITVGKEAVFKVLLNNSGDLPAANVEVVVTLPGWAEVHESFGSSGQARASSDLQSEGIRWSLNSLASRGREELTIRVVARRSDPFNLGVRWSCSPAVSQATIEVQEPKLHMQIAGPRDVEFGSQQVYKLTVSNPGTGPAENVVIHLLPLVPGETATASQPLGTLRAGESKVIEVELTARQAGRLTISAEAAADAGLHVAASEEVVVRRAALDVALTAPKLHFAGLPASFEVRVQNTGDAPARNLRIATALPRDTQFLEASNEGQHDAKGNQVWWNLKELAPGGELTFSFKCVLQSAGSQRLIAAVSASDDLKVATEAMTQVMARADLAMQVVDAQGPIPVGQDVSYEIRVRNRGTKSAEGIEIVTFFSEGIEPVGVEGAEFDLQPGVAEIKAIPMLPPGEERVVRVKARAQASGSHRFRVELECPSLGTRLTHENTTFFYGDDMESP